MPLKEEDIRPQKLFNRYLELAEKDTRHFFADHSGFVNVACPGCGSYDSEPGLDKLGFQYLLCRDCASLYQSPRPDSDMIKAYYQEGEAIKYWATNFFKQTADARREHIFKPRAQLVAEWTRDAQNEADRERVFVDIGSGYGIFLDEIARLGQFDQILGIEPSPNLAAVCRERGYTIIEKPIEEVGPNEIQADFASAFEVLEHLFDPQQFLEAAHRILRPGGLLLLTTLTVSGFDIQVLWGQSKSVYPPHHINLLSVEGMRRLLMRTGFEIVELSTPGQLDVDIVSNTAKENPKLELPRFVRQLIDHPDEGVRSRFQTFLQEANLSSHIRVIVRRAD